jgi:predicted dehydrogenase
MKAILVGLGGIGSNVYLPQLQNLGFNVTTVDLYANEADYQNVTDIKGKFEVGICCTPNHSHELIAQQLADKCKVVLVEKPGLPSADMWSALCDENPKTKFVMCKNNMYRNNLGAIQKWKDSEEKPLRIEINWLNKNRVPNPGGWSTNRKMAWGGVALDLFPHLYTQLINLTPLDSLERGGHSMAQQWQLSDLMDGSDYGNINIDGVYNVCDFAEESWVMNGVTPITLRASWKAGYDDQSIKVITADSEYIWHFGLCPDYAYGEMIHKAMTEDYSMHRYFDEWIHKQLEVYHEG